MQAQWWEQDDVVARPPTGSAASPAGSVIVGTPNPRLAAQDQRAREDQQFQRDKAAREEQRFQIQTQREADRDRRADGTAARAEVAASRLPNDREDELRTAIDLVSGLNRAQGGFRSDYMGLGTGIENFAQSYSPINVGTPGQRDWWAAFRKGDNLERNKLFGASLTGGEKSAYAATTITPDMNPDQARQNIQRRAAIARTGLGRYRQYLIDSGYGEKAIDTLMGDALAAPTAPEPQRRAEDGVGALAAQPMGASVDNVADVLSGVSGGRYAIERDGLFYTPPGGRPEIVDVSDAVANSDEYRTAYRAKFGTEPQLQVSVEGGVSDLSRPAGLAVERGQGGFVETADAFIRGAADTVALGGADELAAAGRTIFGDGTMRDNLRAERAVDTYDNENNFGARVTGQLAGGFALPVGGAGAVSAGRMAGIGAGYSGAYGFGSTEGSALDRLRNAGTNAVAGGALGYGLGRVATSLQSLGSGRAASPAQDLMTAASRQGIEPLPADVGGPFTRRMTSAAAQGPLSAGPIIRGGKRVNDQVGTARDRIASGVGTAGDPYAAGEAAQSGAAAYIQASRTQVDGMYDAARRQVGGARPVAQRAVDTLDANLAELAETPSTSAPVTAALERLGADLTEPGGLSIDALRRLRTNVRGMAYTDELRGTDFERRAGQVLNAISDDIADALPAPARASFRAADQAHRERVETIDQVLRPIVGGRGDKAFAPEKVFQNIQAASRSDSGRLRRFVQALPDDDAADVAASVIGQLGRASAGAQGAESVTFSTTQFLTHWNQMSTRAKLSLFQGETRAALDDLARVAEGTKEAAGYANRSNSAGAVGSNVLAWVASTFYSPTMAVVGGATQYVTGRLLASPRFARWLARPARTPDERATAVRRLGGLIAREPALRADLLPIQKALDDTQQGQPGMQTPRR
jgi:hypothetical protein